MKRKIIMALSVISIVTLVTGTFVSCKDKTSKNVWEEKNSLGKKEEVTSVEEIIALNKDLVNKVEELAKNNNINIDNGYYFENPTEEKSQLLFEVDENNLPKDRPYIEKYRYQASLDQGRITGGIIYAIDLEKIKSGEDFDFNKTIIPEMTSILSGKSIDKDHYDKVNKFFNDNIRAGEKTIDVNNKIGRGTESISIAADSIMYSYSIGKDY